MRSTFLPKEPPTRNFWLRACVSSWRLLEKVDNSAVWNFLRFRPLHLAVCTTYFVNSDYGTAYLQGNECSRVTHVLHASDMCVTSEWHMCYIWVTCVLHLSDTHVTSKWHTCYIRMTHVLHSSDTRVTCERRVCYTQRYYKWLTNKIQWLGYYLVKYFMYAI